ncbi:short transient receptor potential channel 3 [Plakobranchus ocellatus]|uniref:Short transient receptor potential channel 3 n=1 Tax=Plakobranchus ocellatus TaxID=259542 RepID=A0AAV4CRB4_9GAST|nr:short transient receptor potential channel 3 [Plakobranchus ocellatus]
MVVLLNLLIAVMSNSFQEVQDDRDVEWKFARTELWLTFIGPGTPVMPPFNIMPSPRHIYRLLLWMCRRSQFRHLLPHEGKKVRYVAVQTGSILELQDMEEDKSEASNIDGHYTRNVSSTHTHTRNVLAVLRHLPLSKHNTVTLVSLRITISQQTHFSIALKLFDHQSSPTVTQRFDALLFSSSDEQLRRQIERLGSRVEQRLTELHTNLHRLQREVDKVKEENNESQKLQVEHYDKFVEFSGRKTSENDRYEALLDEAKLQILARMDSERIQMERVLEHRVGTLARKLDDSTISLSQQVDRLQAITTRGSSSTSSSPLHKPKY